MNTRLWPFVTIILLCHAVPPASAETVTETWRGGFYQPTSLSVNTTDGSCWVASSNLLGNDPVVAHVSSTGVELWRSSVAEFGGPSSLSVNSSDGSCWVADGQIVHLSAGGKELWRGGGGFCPSVSVNPTDGSCWVADAGNSQVAHLSASGEELWRGDAFISPCYVSVNPTDGSCWVADPGAYSSAWIVHLSSSGAELWRSAPGAFIDPSSVSVNPSDGSCWVADRGTYSASAVVRLSASGEELWRGSAFINPCSVCVNPTDGSCWVADQGRWHADPLTCVGSDVTHISVDGTEQWRGPVTLPAGPVAVNPGDGSCWVAEPDGAVGPVVHLSASGGILWQGEFCVPVVAVNPSDGSCWVAATNDNRVVHLSGGGAELWQGNGFREPASASVNPIDGSCWVADTSNDQVVHLSLAGGELWRGGGFHWPESVSVDPGDGSCWVADPGNSQVVHLSESGAELWQSASGAFSSPCSVSVNPNDGSCWVADIWQVVHLSASGQELWRGGGFNEPGSVSVNSSDGSCWVADDVNGQVVHLSEGGSELWRSSGKTFYFPVSVSVNPSDGSCWVADTGWYAYPYPAVVHLSSTGTELWRGQGFIAPSSVSVNPSDGSCWVGDGYEVVHLVIVAGALSPGGPIIPADPPAGSERHFLIGELHAHWMSDSEWGVPLGASLTPTSLEYLYWAAGYNFIAPTEHHPDPKWVGLAPGMFQDPKISGILHLGDSVEDSCGGSPTGASHILGAAFNWQAMDHSLLGSGDRVGRLDNIRNEDKGNGLAFVAHPDSEKYLWSDQTLMSLSSHYDGLEVFNGAMETIPTLRWDGQSSAIDTWTVLLNQGYEVHAICSDDFTPNVLFAFDYGNVTAVIDTPPGQTPTKADVVTALREGRYYASYRPWYVPYGASCAPQIEGWWWDASAQRARIRVSSPWSVEIRFYTKRNPDRGEHVSLAEVTGSPDTWEASYSCTSADAWVRADVTASPGMVSLTQPIWLNRVESCTAQWPAALERDSRGVGDLTLDLVHAHLELSPQAGCSTVDGELVGVQDRPAASPPLGYFGYCYSFTPQAALTGTNTLTISYEPAEISLCPENALSIYWYNPITGLWQALFGTVDTVGHTVTASPTSLGLFALSGDTGEDAIAPQVQIVSPTAGAVVPDQFDIQVEANDNNGVSVVSFYFDDLYLGSDTQGADGWGLPLDCTRYAEGNHTLTVFCRDASGNEAEDAIVITIGAGQPAPSLIISEPASGASFWNHVRAAGSWSGALAMSAGLLYVDGLPVATLTANGDTWESSACTDLDLEGIHVLKAVGSDANGNTAYDEVTVAFRRFSDIPLDLWARSQIYAAANAGIVNGYSDGTYHPEYSVTRDQMAVYVSRAMAGGDAAVPKGIATVTFADVPTSHWAHDYVEYAYAHQVVKGFSSTSYQPGGVVNRGQMAVFVARAKGWISISDDMTNAPQLFPDVPAGYWAGTAVQACVQNSVVHGYDDGTYKPDAAVTRDQMAVYVQRAFQLPM